MLVVGRMVQDDDSVDALDVELVKRKLRTRGIEQRRGHRRLHAEILLLLDHMHCFFNNAFVEICCKMRIF
jgi:hypothetical protein